LSRPIVQGDVYVGRADVPVALVLVEVAIE